MADKKVKMSNVGRGVSVGFANGKIYIEADTENTVPTESSTKKSMVYATGGGVIPGTDFRFNTSVYKKK